MRPERNQGAVSKIGRRLSDSYEANTHAAVRSLVPAHVSVLHLGCGDGSLLSDLYPSRGVGADVSEATLAAARMRHPHLEFVCTDYAHLPALGTFAYVVVGTALGRVTDLLPFFQAVRSCVEPGGRLLVAYESPMWAPVLSLAESVGLKARAGDAWKLPVADLVNILELAGFEAVTIPPRRARLRSCLLARPAASPDRRRALATSCSVVIPARNERGNVRAAVDRLPRMGAWTEVVFVEGHSTDGTADEIRALIAERPDWDITLVEQGRTKGKGDAMRKGFAAARGDVLVILDADLAVPPEDLTKFWDALLDGKGAVINGTRLVCPMERHAMRSANLAANKLFSNVLTWILRQRVTDTLCGTKAIWARDYQRICANRHLFGSPDPFGDFDLLFGAALLGLRIREVPIRYRARTYGATQIPRWRGGMLLAGMAVRGARTLTGRARRLTPAR